MNTAAKLFSRVLVFTLLLVMTNQVIAETVSHSSADENFVLTEVESNNIMIGSQWDLSYPDADSKINIEKVFRKNSVEYIVRSEFFEVRYVNGKNGFGVRAIRPNQANTPLEMNSIIINGDQMANQKILVPTTVNDKVAVGLIGSYLPQLLNDNYKHIL